MKALVRRLRQLEGQIAMTAETGWGSLAGLRDMLLQLAQPRVEQYVAKLKNELDDGRCGHLGELIRCHQLQHGFVQGADESLAETAARRRWGLACGTLGYV